MEAEKVLKQLNEAYSLFFKGDRLGYDALLEQSREHIGPSGEERWLWGEWKLVSVLASLRDLKACIRIFDETIIDLGGRRSQIFDVQKCFQFGSDSVFWLYMREPGQAERTGILFNKMLERYQMITGSGQGYTEFYQAELAYHQGDLIKARPLAYQAAYLAKSTRQMHLVMSSAKLIGHIALHMRDMQDWRFAIESVSTVLDSEQDEDTARMLRSTAQLLYAEMLLQLDDMEALPSWVKGGDFNVSSGVAPCNMKYAINDPHITACDYPLALWIHALYLLRSGQHARALAADSVQRMFGIEKEFVCYQIYYCLLRGLCYYFMDDRKRAAAEFASAVEMIAPDGLWLVVAEFAPASNGLLLEAVKTCGGNAGAVQRIARGYIDNSQKLKEMRQGQDMDRLLTSREREIAGLAADGLRNKEIAQRLNVTEQTVKFHLSNIYSKLDINSRARLAATLRSQTKNYTKV